jgi:hypothetical protein
VLRMFRCAMVRRLTCREADCWSKYNFKESSILQCLGLGQMQQQQQLLLLAARLC